MNLLFVVGKGSLELSFQLYGYEGYMKPSLIARVTVNTTVTWLRKTVSRYSGAFSIIVQMYAE